MIPSVGQLGQVVGLAGQLGQGRQLVSWVILLVSLSGPVG